MEYALFSDTAADEEEQTLVVNKLKGVKRLDDDISMIITTVQVLTLSTASVHASLFSLLYSFQHASRPQGVVW